MYCAGIYVSDLSNVEALIEGRGADLSTSNPMTSALRPETEYRGSVLETVEQLIYARFQKKEGGLVLGSHAIIAVSLCVVMEPLTSCCQSPRP